MKFILSHPLVYQIWQYPFYQEKMAPILQAGDIKSAQNVLEIGCGPGTNARFFKHCNYLGVDLSAHYIDYARRHFKGTFEVRNVNLMDPLQYSKFDFLLMNSLMHHLSDDEVSPILSNINRMLAAEGSIHIIDLAMPESTGIAKWLAMQDRGKYVRSIKRWQELFSNNLNVEKFEPFSLKRFGIELWRLIYCKARAKS